MKRTYNFEEDENQYVLRNSNPNETKKPFTIDKETLEFDTRAFYEYIFSDAEWSMDYEVKNQIEINDNQTKRILNIIEEIIQGVSTQLKEREE